MDLKLICGTRLNSFRTDSKPMLKQVLNRYIIGGEHFSNRIECLANSF